MTYLMFIFQMIIKYLLSICLKVTLFAAIFCFVFFMQSFFVFIHRWSIVKPVITNCAFKISYFEMHIHMNQKFAIFYSCVKTKGTFYQDIFMHFIVKFQLREPLKSQIAIFSRTSVFPKCFMSVSIRMSSKGFSKRNECDNFLMKQI